MHTLKRKTTALLLVVAMLFSLLPAFPQTAEAATAQGNGGYVTLQYESEGLLNRTITVNVLLDGQQVDSFSVHDAKASMNDISITVNDSTSYEIAGWSGVSYTTATGVEIANHVDETLQAWYATWEATANNNLVINVNLRTPVAHVDVVDGIYKDGGIVDVRAYEPALLKLLHLEDVAIPDNGDLDIKKITLNFYESIPVYGDSESLNDGLILGNNEANYYEFPFSNPTHMVSPMNIKSVTIDYENGSKTIPADKLQFVYHGGGSPYYSLESNNQETHIVYFYNQDGALVHYSTYAVRFVEDGASLGENMPEDPDYGDGNLYIFVNWEIEDTDEPFFSNTPVTKDLSVFAQKVSSPGSGGTQIHADNTDNELIARIVEVYNAEHGTAITAQDVDKNSITMSVSETDGTTTNREYYNNKWFTYDGDEYYRMWNLDVPIGSPTLKNDHVAYDDISTLNVFFNLNDGSEEQSISLPIGENAGEISKSMVDADTIIRLAVIDAPTAPTAPDLEDDPTDPDDAYILGDGSVKVDCTEDETHTDGSYALLSGSYDVGNVYWKGSYKNGNGAYYVDVTVNNDAYVTKYNETSEGHTISGDESQTITLKWENNTWNVETSLPVVFTVTCDGGAAADGIILKYNANGGKYANGNDEAWAEDLKPGTHKLWEGDAIPDGFDLPTYDQVDGKDVVLIGWTEKADDKIYTKDDTAPTILTEITLEKADKKVYAVWGYDENGNGKPDVTEETYSLTYDATSGKLKADGKVGETAAVENLLNDKYTLWAKDKDGKLTGTYPDGYDALPVHYPITVDEESVSVLFAGWSLTDTKDYIYDTDNKGPERIKDLDLTKDTTVYAVWSYDINGNGVPDIDEDITYSLTYDANGGTFKVDGSETQLVDKLTAGEKTLWTKNGEGVKPEVEGIEWPTHADAKTPEGSVIAQGDTVSVVMMGWTDDESAAQQIYAAGQKYPDIDTVVTLNEKNKAEKVYAVWGYDENGDGVADAQQIVITPADITIYEGGDGYTGVVGDEGVENGTITNGLAEPGFYLILPYTLDDKLGGAGNTENLAGKLRLTYTNPKDLSDMRQWVLKDYNTGVDSAKNVVPYDRNGDGDTDDQNDFFYVYQLEAQEGGSFTKHPVRLEVKTVDKNGDGEADFVTTDEVTLDVDQQYVEYPMRLYNEDSVDRTVVKAEYKIDDGAWTEAEDVKGIARGFGTMTIRGVNETDEAQLVSEVIPANELTAEPTKVTAVEPEDGNVYNVNDSDVPVVNQNDVKLLNDTLALDTTEEQMMVDEIVDASAGDIQNDFTFDFHYLDLVDSSNGNAYVTLADGDTVELYWPYPDGMDKNDTFYIAHFDGMDRNFNGMSLEDELNHPEVAVQIYSEDNATYKLEKTDKGIKITTSSFSPFALVYDNEGSGTIDPPPVDPGEPGGGGDNPPALNTEDHFSYVVGYEDGMVKPQRNITRAEVSSIFYRLLEDEVRDDNTTDVSDFSDVSASDWYGTTVATLSKMGIVKGYEDGTFRPNAPITRAEFVAIATRFFEETGAEYEPGTFTDVTGDEWFAGAIQDAVNLGLIGGYEDGSVRPNNNITRAEACAIVNRTLGRVPDADHLLPTDEMKTWPDNQPSDWFYADMQEATNGHEYEWIT
ncbi:MAG: S-layer homology domain-containing protein, partial [Peptococcaceae bacterium]|nr:S-layer homology domain-containing protein [Peptococcaceae bacterium]